MYQLHMIQSSKTQTAVEWYGLKIKRVAEVECSFCINVTIVCLLYIVQTQTADERSKD